MSTTGLKVLDGGLATQLIEMGCHHDIDNEPLWSSKLIVTAPELVKQAHMKFLRVGADIIGTNTYQANVDNLQRHLSVDERKAIDLIVQAVRLAQEARDEFMAAEPGSLAAPLIAGSVGPYGAAQCDGSEYTGAYVDTMSIEALRSWHYPRVAALVAAGVDLLACETIPAQLEAQALCDVISQFPTVRAWISFSTKGGGRTCRGESLDIAAAPALANPQIIGVGVNCCAPTHVATALRCLQSARQHDKLLVVYPNSGEEWDTTNKWHGGASALHVSGFVEEWLELGASWIGGCCRVYDRDIVRIRAAMDEARKRPSHVTMTGTVE